MPGPGQFVLQLPPELRAEIYRHVFSSNSCSPEFMFLPLWGNSLVRLCTALAGTAILCVNRQTYEEALLVFYKISTFCWPFDTFVGTEIKGVTTILESMKDGLRNRIQNMRLILMITPDDLGLNTSITHIKSTLALLVKSLPGLKRVDVGTDIRLNDPQFLGTQNDISAVISYIVDVTSPLRSVRGLSIVDYTLVEAWNYRSSPELRKQEAADIVGEAQRIISRRMCG